MVSRLSSGLKELLFDRSSNAAGVLPTRASGVVVHLLSSKRIADTFSTASPATGRVSAGLPLTRARLGMAPLRQAEPSQAVRWFLHADHVRAWVRPPASSRPPPLPGMV